MDDSYQLPAHSDVMGKGCITTLFKNRAVISCEFGDNYTVEILSKETFGNPTVDLKDKFDMGEEVVYKANRRVPPIAVCSD
uniref:Uncharacterized protein n=1 Tax=Romanomermis culicivorax TaxID=13658 RepID=A0A915JQL0_ROMCU